MSTELSPVKIAYADHRQDLDAWAASLGISREAVDIYAAAEVFDLHIDTFIWKRILGYDLGKRHGRGPFGARFFHQVDLPRLREARVGGGMWSITTNPLRSARGRAKTFVTNVAKLHAELGRYPDDVAVVHNLRELRAARAKDLHAAMIVVQGGNALDHTETSLDLIPDDLVVLVTLVHLSTSSLGRTSSPAARGPDTGLTDKGKDYVRQLDAKNIFVDLAHVSKKGFWDAVAAHDKTKPLCDSHTGVEGVTPHWRNLDDAQIKAIADTGGVVGVIYQSTFLGGGVLGCKAERIVDHLQHIIKVAGEDVPALGSDWDGMIVPPRDMPTCLELPRLVQLMLDRGWKADRIGKILGANFFASFGRLRP
ncbi:MAG: rane dipeptidase [Myxococcales bacterium]|nr:rane dipeptidase [Myxococcales bacterium]